MRSKDTEFAAVDLPRRLGKYSLLHLECYFFILKSQSMI